MCFMIDIAATAPRKKYGYKVVRLKGHEVRSLYKNSFRWQTGVNWPRNYEGRIDRTLRRGDFSTSECGYESFACRGIYVYLNREHALSRIREGLDKSLVLLKVELDPEDWLYSSVSGEAQCVATYRKVSVPEKQPQIEWY